MFSSDRRTGWASPYELALGPQLDALDPRLRAYFGVIPAGCVGYGVGVFERAGLRVRALGPVFALLAQAGIAFPESAVDVPFEIENRPTGGGGLQARRTFRFRGRSRVMVDELRVVEGRLVDRLGTHGLLEVGLDVAVADGRLRMRSRSLALRLVGMRVPLPRVVTVVLEERTGTDGAGQHVDVRVRAPLFGEVYGYRGRFDYWVRTASGGCSLHT